MRIGLRKNGQVDVAIVHHFDNHIGIGHIMTKSGARSIRVISRDRALQFTIFVADDAGHTIGSAFLFDQVDEFRRVPVDVRVCIAPL